MRNLYHACARLLSATTLVALGLLIVGGLAPQTANSVAQTIHNQPAAQTPINSPLLEEQQRVFREVYESVSPSVVSISVARRTGNFGVSGVGSGFVVDTDGHIVTNYHVVRDATQIEVGFFDGTVTRAEIVGEDPDSDISVIRVDLPAERLVPVQFADSNELFVGQFVLAIGNPFANDWTLTSGIISALNRRISGLGQFSIGGVIQTDTAINPGNSGGPLLNLAGEVIGVNSQINTETGVNSGIGFAVPSNLVNRVAASLIETGSVAYSYLGITSRPIDLSLVETYDLPNNLRGVAIREVRSDTPASFAGLRTLSMNSIDVITAVDGETVFGFDQLIGYLAINTTPGDTITLTVYRDGEYIDLPLTLTARP